MLPRVPEDRRRRYAEDNMLERRVLLLDGSSTDNRLVSVALYLFVLFVFMISIVMFDEMRERDW